MQRWERRFGEDSFTTRQWEEAGLLVEHFAGWELCFVLRGEAGALRYQQCGARLRAGGWRQRMPLLAAPCVEALETAEGSQRVRVEVAVRLPIVGPLISYRGYLEVGEGLLP